MSGSAWWDKPLTELLRDAGGAQESAERLARLDIGEFLATAAHESTPDDLSAMSEDSYAHANGFEKISLPPLPGCERRLRIHIWLRKAPAGAPDAHNHRWALASRILTGSLRNAVFEVSAEGSGRYRHYRHVQKQPPPGYTFEEAGRAELTETAADVHGPGAAYWLPPEAVHVAEPASSGLTATLAVELDPVRHVTDVFVMAGTRPTGQVMDPPRFRPHEVRTKLVELLATTERET